MLTHLRIAGYRSLEGLTLPLGPLTVVTGANGTGKSNLYRCLQLIARSARGELGRALAEEGGMPSVLWSGPRRRTSHAPARAQVVIEVQTETFGYRLTCGLPVPTESLFNRDPEVKEECAWLGPRERPATCVLKRDHRRVQVRALDHDAGWQECEVDASETALSQVQDPRRFPDLELVRGQLQRWRFYHHFRSDADSPLRQPRIGTRTPSLAGDGVDLAAALATIQEIGDPTALCRAVDRLQPGARLAIADVGQGLLELRLQIPGLHREMLPREFSDGTLRYFALAAALLSPRPAPLLAFNEPESSLHPDLVPALADLLVSAAQHSQIWVTTHSETLAQRLRDHGARLRQLMLIDGATRIHGQRLTGSVASDEDDSPAHR